MRKKLVLVLSIGLSIYGYSQENTKPAFEGNNELKLNAAYLLGEYFEASYERLLSDESAVGISIGFALDSDVSYKFGVVPYYRFYFGKKRAAGFFLEANGAIYSEKDRFWGNGERETGIGLGLAIGGKFITSSGWTAEIFGGIGRNFNDSDYLDEIYPRFGITFGKRF